MNRALCLLGLLAGASACSVPMRPHGHVELKPAELRELAEPGVTPLRSPRLLLLGRFDNLATQPIGGLYDEVEYSISPLYRTYFFRDAHLEVFEHVSDALRASGLDVRKDYATAGEAALLEARMRKLKPLLVSGVVKTLQHDQMRVEQPAPHQFEIARLIIGVKVAETDGQVVYDRELRIEGRTEARPDADVLRTLGRALGAALATDPAFRRAVGAS